MLILDKEWAEYQYMAYSECSKIHFFSLEIQSYLRTLAA